MITKIILLAGLVSSPVLAREYMKLSDFVKNELGSQGTLSQETFTLNDTQKSDMKKVAENATDESFKFFYAKKDGKLAKACTVVSQAGKEGPMQVGVCFSPDALVKSVTLLTHEEERGKGVEKVDYLNQYKDKSVDSAFTVGKDVTIKTGATWSSKAVSEAVRKSSFAFKTFVKK